jgi:hypothetical protein
VVVEPGERYRAGWFGRLFLGSQWRDLWTTPIRVPVLDLHLFDGGLTPDREGGGLQTLNLRFKTANGHRWVFRGVDKDPKRVLEPEVRESLLGALAQDLTSTANPGAALMVAPLLDAADVLHATPSLYVMPDDPHLGEFLGSFAKVLGMIELRDEKQIPGVDKVMTTYELFARFEERSDERIDARDYLRARLMDIFVGDWDRHVDQWRWVRFKEESGRFWRAVPRDRDNAFSRFTGVLPSLAAYYTKQLTSFGASYPSIEKLTFAGRFTDRRFLVGLEKPEWDAVTAELVTKLTDGVIEEAVHHLPVEMYVKAGPEITQALKSRRDELPRASDDFYRLLAQDVDVRGTEGSDEAELLRKPDGSVDLTIYSRDERTGQRVGPAFFHRTFKPDETNEIRLYLLGGADRVVVDGASNGSILVRVIDRGNETQVLDQSACKGCTDIRHATGAVPENPSVRYEPPRDWGWDLLFFPLLAYDSSRGLVLGATGVLSRYGFQLRPFRDLTTFDAAYSTATSQPRVDLATRIRTRSPVTFLVFSSYSGMDQVNFFGFGNESIKDPVLQKRGFYQSTQQRVIVRPLVDVALAGPLHARAGGLFEHVSSVNRNTLAGQTPTFGPTSLMAVEGGLEFDASTGISVSARGFKASALARYYPEALGLGSAFGKMRASAAYFVGGHWLTDFVLVLHGAYEKNWGHYPAFEAAFLGGVPGAVGLDPGTLTGNLLRGYDLNRYAGDSALVGNVEGRIALGSYNAVLPMRYGLTAITDVGRVFFAPETSRRWHSGAGGGVWLTLLLAVPGYRIATNFNGVIVASGQGTSFTLYSGFGF